MVEIVVEDALADLVDSANDETFVVDAGEDFAGNFVDFEEMMKVGGGVALAEFAIAAWIERFEHFAVFGVANIDAAVRGVEGAVAGHAGRSDAVKGVAAVFDAKEEVAGLAAHAEEVARFVFWEIAIAEFEDFFGIFFHGVKAADTVAVDVLLGHEFSGFFAEISKEASLDNGKEILVWPTIFASFGKEAIVLGDVLWEPVVGATHGFEHDVVVAGVGGLVEGHVNVSADFPLGLHAGFWSHADFVAVDVRLEGDTFVIDFGVRKGKHLEAAGIGEGWSVPIGELGEAAGFFDEVWAWGKDEVISISKDGLAAESAHFGVRESFDAGASGGADESWRLDVAVRSVDSADAHEADLLVDVEFEV